MFLYTSVKRLQHAGQSSPGCLVAGLPAANCHLQGVVRGEQGRQEGEVGHGAGAVFGANPALNGLFFIGIAICWGEALRVNDTNKHE